MDIQIKRVYEDPHPDDGTRILVDRLWPRRLSKEDAACDSWMQSVAPSDSLRSWFNHDPERWLEFVDRYHAELDEQPEPVESLRAAATTGTLTLVYAAKDEDHNNAVALQAYLEDRE